MATVNNPNSPELYSTPEEKADLEARNGLLQFDEVMALLDQQIATGAPLHMKPEILKRLHYLAIHDIYTCAGQFRGFDVRISNTPHQPPPYTEVERLVEEMCAYVNSNGEKPPVHIAAYLLWRTNWIHPFGGGNGRTSRAVSYLALCAKLGYKLPVTKAIPDQIVEDRQPYYEALSAADEAWANGAINVSEMEQLMARLLAAQLVLVLEAAVGG